MTKFEMDEAKVLQQLTLVTITRKEVELVSTEMII